ncbi:MAG: hypothetical protein ABIN69_11930 [Aestuariivirga sp.]
MMQGRKIDPPAEDVNAGERLCELADLLATAFLRQRQRAQAADQPNPELSHNLHNSLDCGAKESGVGSSGLSRRIQA